VRACGRALLALKSTFPTSYLLWAMVVLCCSEHFESGDSEISDAKNKVTLASINATSVEVS
jgi:hypothetical protein